MFFSIGKQSQENFSNFYRIGLFYISTDAGWKYTSFGQYQCIYKGYADTMDMIAAVDQIVHQAEPELLGNFCVLVYNSETNNLEIKSDRYRSFPIYFDNSGASNLHQLKNIAWSDSLITITNDFTPIESKFDLIGQIDTSYTTLDEVIKKIDRILLTKTQQFLKHNRLPIRAFLSGGVDSLLVYSYLQRFTDQFELVKCQHIDYDAFWLKNSGTLKKLWGYTQIHHWDTPCVLTSGAPGDEFMLRSPVTADLFLKLNGYYIYQMLDQPEWQTCLHYTYYKQDKFRKIFDNADHLPVWDRTEMIRNLCNMLLNDYQHWHLGHTLTWTPLRDLDIIKLLLRLPPEQAFGQIMNSKISKALIEQNQAGLTRVISDQKNSGNAMKNLVDLML
jgi:hypothetical protein